ncbi:YitT family protein [Alkalihalobacillus sp. BA299]|uniref:YczE/YyaS/YitT family protein n=1 Tax=Alkalihalobacillus sp. BA299 TaxID=2815938 RepID=UPI001AD9DD7B|nr:YitT family protein [Alkalihalobacillus sp. BA299]
MKFYKQMFLLIMGLIIVSYGIAVSIQVQHLGIHPWDVLYIALNNNLGLTIGTWNVLIGIFLLFITFRLNRSYIKMGTFLNVLLVGPIVDFFLFLDVFPHSPNGMVDILLLIVAIAFIGTACGMYTAANFGAGPRDGFILAISEKSRMSIRKTRIILESAVLVLALILGGPVFIFTFIYTFIMSPIFQWSYLLCDKWVKSNDATLKQNKDTQMDVS